MKTEDREQKTEDRGQIIWLLTSESLLKSRPCFLAKARRGADFGGNCVADAELDEQLWPQPS
jgi:hypothetical protein